LRANPRAFEHRVICVLRDIEVMHHAPLAKHRHVVQLLGYGWDNARGDTIPYLVTELASQGTLKEYLLRSKTTISEGLRFCRQVAQGLCELHLCGVIHGDLKLDNILACSKSGRFDVPASDVTAKLVSAFFSISGT
jgi:serine/threonine protein kinase